MVVVKLMQGLGNQMFQYSAGKALSLHLNQPLKVNIDNYTPTSLRQYELGKYFNLKPEIVSSEEMSLFNLNHPVRRFWNKAFPSHKIKSLPYEEPYGAAKALYNASYKIRKPHLQSVYEERHFHYDPHFFDAKAPIFLKGYWYSYKYFHAHKELLSHDFTVKEELVSHLDLVVKEMKEQNSIAIHVRCTDKLSPVHLKLHGKLSQSYYTTALDHMRSKLGNDVTLYVFTDDVYTAKAYIPQDVPVVWVSNYITKSSIEDFYLMQFAKGVITSNSTFSWWAAYLNKNENPLVVVPKKWYAKNTFDARDVYCDEWIKK